MKKTFPATLSNLYEMLTFIKESAHDHPNIFHVELASEEVLVNIITHGNTDEVEILCDKKSDALEITFKDIGLPFDPVTFSPLEGHGLTLVKQIASDISYKRDKDQNILTLLFIK